MPSSQKAVIVASLTATVFLGFLLPYSWIKMSSEVTSVIDSSGQIRTVQYVRGDKILEANGSEVVWRGAGGSYLFHAGDRYQEAWQLHLPPIQNMKLNTMRLAFAFPDSSLNINYDEPSADIIDYNKLEWVLDFLSQHGIRAILDLHNYNDMAGDFGSQKLVDDWVRLAQHYRGDSRVVAYELFNEPGPSTWDASVTCQRDVIRAYADLTDAVRSVDSDHIVIWQSYGCLANTWDIDKFADVLQPYLKPNIVFTFHRWLQKESCFGVWNPEQASYIGAEYLVKTRQKLKVPFWLGEFGSYSPFNFSNPEFQWTEQILWRCEEQVLGWNLWMGRTGIDKPWKEYLPLFPLKVYNERLVRGSWNMPIPDLKDFVIQSAGVDKSESYRMEMWHNNDYATLRPGIVVRVVVGYKPQDGSLELVSDETIKVIEQLTIRNERGTVEHPGDWNVRIYSIGFAS